MDVKLENYAKTEEAKVQELVIVSGAAVGIHFCERYRLDQCATAKFAESFEMVPKTLADNAFALTISFAGDLLQNAEELIRMGLHPSEIISGYTKAINRTVEILDELVEKGSETMDVCNKEQIVSRMKAAVASKQFGQEVILCSLLADACIQMCLKNRANFNVDNVSAHSVWGMVSKNDVVGAIKLVEKAKLENYAKTEEAKVEELIKAVADSGAKVIVSGAAVGLHFCQRYKLDQYAIAKFAESFEMVPKTLAGNAGVNAMEIISSLYTELASGNTKVGIDLEEGACKDASIINVWDLHVTKLFALRYAADAACTVLRVDQIIMSKDSKPAGGPRRDQPAGMDEV